MAPEDIFRPTGPTNRKYHTQIYQYAKFNDRRRHRADSTRMSRNDVSLYWKESCQRDFQFKWHIYFRNATREKRSYALHNITLMVEADLSDWAPLTDYENLNVEWHVPSDDETACAISLFKTAADSRLQQINDLISPTSSDDEDAKKSSADWTDELRECLKYLVSAMLASIPLYQRCSPPEEWDLNPRDAPDIKPPPEMMDVEEDFSDADQPDVEEEDAVEEDEDEDFSDSDSATGRSQKYADGFINRPLSPEQAEILRIVYVDIGSMLSLLVKYLWLNRKDDMQSFVEVT